MKQIFPSRLNGEKVALFLTLLILANYAALFADDLPACGDYVLPDFWFEFDDFWDDLEEFEHVYEPRTLAVCTAGVWSTHVLFQCDGWSTSLDWYRTDSDVPFTEGQSVFIYAADSDYMGASEQMSVFDENMNLVIAHYRGGGEIDYFLEGETYFTRTDICRYLPEDVMPGFGEEDWEYVNGQSLEGYFDGSHYFIPAPRQWAATDDGVFDIFLPINYTGECLDADCPASIITVQVVPGESWPPVHDADDDTTGDDITDDTSPSDDDDTEPADDAATGDDDDDDGGCCG